MGQYGKFPVSVKILLSPSQPDSWHMKKRKFSKSTLRVSKLNSMSAELFLVSLPVRITVEREILTVRKIFRFGQNSSKSQPARLLAHEKAKISKVDATRF